MSLHPLPIRHPAWPAWLAALPVAWLLAACAGVPPVPPDHPATVLRDDRFGPPREVVDPPAILAADAAMRRFLAVDAAPLLRRLGPVQGLATVLQPPDGLRLRYDASRTRTAAETFAARSGNCLSLVLMTAALAKELGLRVQYQAVDDEPSWSRDGSLYVEARHIDISLAQSLPDSAAGRIPRDSLTIDFLPPEQLVGRRIRAVDERTVLTLFMNNRAAEALAREDLDSAYAWARAAVLNSPGLPNAYNTLAVIYQRHGDLPAAEATLRAVLARDARQTSALANLAFLLRGQQRLDEARPLEARLAQLEAQAPFHDFKLGLAALQAGDARGALGWFQRELAREPDYHEFNLWAGVAEWRLGDREAAQRHFRLAMAQSPDDARRALYAAKWARLQGLAETR